MFRESGILIELVHEPAFQALGGAPYQSFLGGQTVRALRPFCGCCGCRFLTPLPCSSSSASYACQGFPSWESARAAPHRMSQSALSQHFCFAQGARAMSFSAKERSTCCTASSLWSLAEVTCCWVAAFQLFWHLIVSWVSGSSSAQKASPCS